MSILVGLVIGIGLIKDNIISAISFIISQFWNIVSMIGTYITSITSMIPIWGYVVGGVVFGPLILVLIYCVWIRLNDNAKSSMLVIAIVISLLHFLSLLTPVTPQEVPLRFACIIFNLILICLFIFMLPSDKLSNIPSDTGKSLYYEGER